MMRLIKSQALSLLMTCCLLSSSWSSSGQIKVTRLTSPEELAGRKGIVYALPRTVVGVDLTVCRIMKYPGPLAEYSREFLGTSDVITKNSVEYSLEGAVLNKLTEPDPEQLYLIEKEEKSQGEIWLSFGRDEKSLSAGSFPKESSPEGFSQWNGNLYTPVDEAGLYSRYSASATREVIDTVIRKVSIDTLVIEETTYKRSLVEYPDRDKAQDAIDRINRIESDIYNLLIGYQETAYSREAIEFMYDKLQAERREYLSLFTGVTVKENLVFHFRVIPDPVKESPEYILAGFSESGGLVRPDEENKISLIVVPDAGNYVNPDLSKSQGARGVVYRIPARLLMKLEFNGRELTSETFEVLQFGPMLALPPEFKKCELDLESGIVRSIVME